MALIVQKFGGTSLASLAHIKNVANIIAESASKHQLVIVVSAMAGVTNSLASQCSQLSNLTKTNHRREYDATLASGEIVTASLLALQMQIIGLQAKSLQGWQVPIITNDEYSNAYIEQISINLLTKLINDQIIPVITGFQGINLAGDVTTLGKGGSDTSAALIAASLQADRCDIYTDVDGIYSADPRVVNTAHRLDNIDIDELCTLCTHGAKILHPRAALAAKKYNFDLRILSSFKKGVSTSISNNNKQTMEKQKLTAITSDKNLLKIELNYPANSLPILCREFSKSCLDIKELNIKANDNCHIITNLTEKNKIIALLDNLQQAAKLANYTINENVAIVTLVGYAVKNNSSFLTSALDLLVEHNIEIMFLQSCDLKLSLLINDRDTEKSVRLLHDYFISKDL